MSLTVFTALVTDRRRCCADQRQAPIRREPSGPLHWGLIRVVRAGAVRKVVGSALAPGWSERRVPVTTPCGVPNRAIWTGRLRASPLLPYLFVGGLVTVGLTGALAALAHFCQ